MTDKNYLADYAKSFNWAGFFLPKIIYNDCSKLYAFCRVLDDIVDGKSNLKLRIKRISEIKNILNKTYELDSHDRNTLDQNEYEVIIRDVITLVENNNVKRLILNDLIVGVSSDLKPKVYLRSIKDLLV